MSLVEFNGVVFAYDENPVFSELSLSIPSGITAVVGPNGSGKSTFLLLASGRVRPNSGKVLLENRDIGHLEETERGRICSLVYQNMEFETEQALGELLEFVFSNGCLPSSESQLVPQVIEAFELKLLLTRPTSNLSKGEMQRAVMAFSLLYGSRVIMMDEPVFALEDAQKRRAMAFLCDHARAKGLSLLYCAHELELNRVFSDQVLLFSKKGPPRLGSPEQILSKDSLEAAYQVPHSLLYKKEELHRSFLQER